jgi:hypothetical protein
MRLDFIWTKTEDNQLILKKNHSVRALRILYLRSMAKYRHEGRCIVFTDETNIHGSQSMPFSCSNTSIHGLLVPVFKGQWMIIIQGETI